MLPLTFIDAARATPGRYALARARTPQPTTTRSNRLPRQAAARRPFAPFRIAIAIFALWYERIRGRRGLRELCALDDHILQDIGLTRSQLVSEMSKPFWR